MEIISTKTISEIVAEIESILKVENLEIEITDFTRPWGGFFVIKEKCVPIFLEQFFHHQFPIVFCH